MKQLLFIPEYRSIQKLKLPEVCQMPVKTLQNQQSLRTGTIINLVMLEVTVSTAVRNKSRYSFVKKPERRKDGDGISVCIWS